MPDEQLDLGPIIQQLYDLTTRLVSHAPTGRVDLGATQEWHDAMLALTIFRDKLRRKGLAVHDESFWKSEKGV